MRRRCWRRIRASGTGFVVRIFLSLRPGRTVAVMPDADVAFPRLRGLQALLRPYRNLPRCRQREAVPVDRLAQQLGEDCLVVVAEIGPRRGAEASAPCTLDGQDTAGNGLHVRD